ncbi:MAG: hypothetical protein QNJ37_05615 [Crocosphaera sp.]|nr:hypothetical protein [Crocosphaera sp.]
MGITSLRRLMFRQGYIKFSGLDEGIKQQLKSTEILTQDKPV